MFFYFLFIFITANECSYTFTSHIGFENHYLDTDDGNIVCINVSDYPFYLVVRSFSDDTMYYQYQSGTKSDQLSLKFSTLLRFLPLYQTIQDPFGSISIETPTGTHLSFTTASLPGICTDGIFFSTQKEDNIILSPKFSSFYSLNVYDDKCILFSNGAQQNISFSIESNDFEDQLFIYRNYTDFFSINVNISSTIISSENPESLLLARIVADDLNPPTFIEISMKAINNIEETFKTRNPNRDFYIPTKALQTCEFETHWYNETIVICIIILTILLGILALIIFSSMCLCSHSNPFVDEVRIKDVHNENEYFESHHDYSINSQLFRQLIEENSPTERSIFI